MDNTIAAEYRRIRKETPALAAKTALLIARHNQKPTELEWELFDGNHVATAKGERDGYDIRVVIDYDQWASNSVTFTDENTGILNPRYRYDDGNGWYGGREYGSDKRYIELESGYTVPMLADDLHQRGMSKSVALDEARASLLAEAKMYLSEEYVQVVVNVTAYIDGVKLGDAGIASDFELSYGKQQERDFEDCVMESNLIEEAIEDARSNLESVIEAEKKRVAKMEARNVERLTRLEALTPRRPSATL